MAKTLIGQLIVRLKAEGLGEAGKVQNVMRDIEASAQRLARSPTGAWGVGFQRQLDRLKLTKGEIAGVQTSWTRLHDAIQRKGLTGALRSSEVSNWKNATVMHFAAVRDEHGRAMKAIEDRARRHANFLKGVGRAALVAGGAYTGVYGAGMVARRGIAASAVEERERFRQRVTGIPVDERNRIADSAESLALKYPSVPVSEVMEMARYSYSLMGDVDRAVGVMESLLKSLVVLQSVKGPDAAGSQLTSFLRGLDNLGVNKDGEIGIKQVNDLVEAVTKAAQVDPDINPAEFFSFARRAKVAGPALSPDFLARAPVFMQDMGADTAGNSLGMAFKAFVLEAVGSAGGKKYIAERDRLGLRDSKGLKDASLFGSDPDSWVLKHLIPALERDGVDMTDDTAIATAVGKLSGNTNATGLLTRIITQRDQIERWLKLADQAMGLDAADAARHEDPFVGWEAFKSSWSNLAAAMGGMPQITAGLNTFADTINNLQQRIRDGDPLVSGTLTAAGIGAAGGGAYVLGRGVWGLITAGTNLNTAAANLNLAAARLAGGGLVDGSPQKGKSIFGTWPMLVGGALLSLGGSSTGNSYADATEEDRAKMRDEARKRTDEINAKNPDSWRKFFFGAAAEEGFSLKDQLAIKTGTAARSAGADIQDALSVTATPTVDTSSIDIAIGKARQLRTELEAVGGAVSSASANVGSELRRNFAD